MTGNLNGGWTSKITLRANLANNGGDRQDTSTTIQHTITKQKTKRKILPYREVARISKILVDFNIRFG